MENHQEITGSAIANGRIPVFELHNVNGIKTNTFGQDNLIFTRGKVANEVCRIRRRRTHGTGFIALADDKQIAAKAPFKEVRAGTPNQQIIPKATVEGIIPLRTHEDIVAAITEQAIIAQPANQLICTWSANRSDRGCTEQDITAFRSNPVNC